MPSGATNETLNSRMATHSRVCRQMLCSRTSPSHSLNGSMVHVELQPSPFAVLWSSQASRLPRMPSPQVVLTQLYVGAVPLHALPGSHWHVALQPLPLVWPPSSHCSVPPTRPSPQVVSMTQVELQPSLFVLLL